MHSYDFGHADEIGRAERVIDPHGEEIAYRHDGEKELRLFADELHVHGESRIARVIEIAVGRLDHETARVSAIAAVRHRAAVHRDGQFNPAKVSGGSSAMIHRLVDILQTLFRLEPIADFEWRDHFRASALCDLDQVRDMVAVPVGNKDEIGGHLFDA